MELGVLQCLAPKTPPTPTILRLTNPTPTLKYRILPHLSHGSLRISATNSDNSSSSSDSSSPQPPPVRPQPITSPETVEIRFRRGSRRRSRQLQEKDGTANGPKKAKAPPKEWEAMTITEKAVELYVGEKGILFWLNKFAYASIFIMIGAWIVFRFVGPALNLYQLDTPPLSPSSILKGS